MLAKRLVLVGAGGAIFLAGTAVVFDNAAREQVVTAVGSGPSASPGALQLSPRSPIATRPAPLSIAPSEDSPGTAEPGGKETNAPGSGGTDNSRALEVLPPVTASPTGLPGASPLVALVKAPFPAAAYAHGKTVDGFPSEILSFPDGTVVVFTGVSSSGDTFQATAEGIADIAPEKVLGHFQQVLQSSGFRAEEVPDGAGQQAIRLIRGNDSVSVTLSITGTGSARFSLLANLHAEPGA